MRNSCVLHRTTFKWISFPFLYKTSNQYGWFVFLIILLAEKINLDVLS